MPILHMETEDVARVGQMLIDVSALLVDVTGRLNASWQALEWEWEGPAKQEFAYQVSQLYAEMSRLSSTASDLGGRVLREVGEWEDVASRFGPGAGVSGEHRLIQEKLLDREERWETVGDKIGRGVAAFFGGAVAVGGKVLDGINNGIDWVGDRVMEIKDDAEDAAFLAVRTADGLIDGIFSEALAQQFDGSSETMELELEGSIVVPGLEVGLPASIKGEASTFVSVTREVDGKYTVSIAGGFGGGVVETSGGVSVGAHVGDKGFSGGFMSEASIGLSVEVEATFEFDPDRPGDMVKMASLLGNYGLGVAGGTTLVAPTLVTMSDNFVGLKVDANVVDAEVDVDGLLGIIDAEADLELGESYELVRNENDQWVLYAGLQASSEVGTSVGASILNALDLGVDIEGAAGVTLQRATNLSTGEVGTRVVGVIEGLEGRSLGFDQQDVSLDTGWGFYGSSEIDIELSVPPIEVVGAVAEGDVSRINGWLEHGGSVEVTETVGSEASIGVEGALGIPSQKLGLSGEAVLRRTSSRTFEFRQGRQIGGGGRVGLE